MKIFNKIKHSAVLYPVIVFAALLLTLCSLSPLTHMTESKSQAQACTSSCNSHGQPSAFNVISEEDQEKEPYPPNTVWDRPALSLSLLYVASVGIAIYLWRKNNLLVQHQQFRF